MDSHQPRPGAPGSKATVGCLIIGLVLIAGAVLLSVMSGRKGRSGDTGGGAVGVGAQRRPEDESPPKPPLETAKVRVLDKARTAPRDRPSELSGLPLDYFAGAWLTQDPPGKDDLPRTLEFAVEGPILRAREPDSGARLEFSGSYSDHVDGRYHPASGESVPARMVLLDNLEALLITFDPDSPYTKSLLLYREDCFADVEAGGRPGGGS